MKCLLMTGMTVFIMAEIGINHSDDLEIAKKLIAAASLRDEMIDRMVKVIREIIAWN